MRLRLGMFSVVLIFSNMNPIRRDLGFRVLGVQCWEEDIDLASGCSGRDLCFKGKRR